ncbi:MAG: SpoIIE family protein phosphatase [Flavobacteriales bacterium]|nr:SpoIIE family protein phosphatase [Flavobacteriales bacterium]
MRTPKDLPILIFSCFLLFAIQPAWAIETITLRDTGQVYVLSWHLEFLEDPTQSLTVEQVSSNEFNDKFYKSDKDVHSVMDPHLDVWLRFRLENIDNVNRFWILELGNGHAGDFEVYYSHDNEKFIGIRNDRDLPYHRRYDHLPHILHNIKVNRDDAIVVYIKMNTVLPMIFKLELHSVPQLIASFTVRSVLLGIFYGMILMLFIYSLFNWYALKNVTYIWFGVYIMALAATIFGFDGNILWLFPNISEETLVRVIDSLLMVSAFAGVTYGQRFLNIPELWPRFNKVLKVLQYLLVAALLFSIVGPIDASALAANLLPMPALMLLVVAGMLSLKKGHQPARLYLLGFGCFAVGGGIGNMAFLGLVPINDFTYYIMHVGSATEAVFLMFALSQQMSLLEKEKEEAQDKALAVLEEKVQERTVEIRTQKEVIEEKNKDITDSIRYAQRIQAAILPKDETIAKSFSDHFVMFKPRDIVSGDFYWFAEQDGKALIAACDCTGHGVPGAFVSMIGNDLLNHTVLENGITNTGAILSGVNQGIKSAFTMGESQDAQDGMDMTLCSFDYKSKKMEFSGANNPLLMFRNGELERTRGDKTPIGGDTAMDHEFETHIIDFKEGDICYIFSDGFQDQFGGPKGKKFMIKKLKELLCEHHAKPFADQKVILEAALKEWMGDLDQVDDILLIGIKL